MQSIQHRNLIKMIQFDPIFNNLINQYQINNFDSDDLNCLEQLHNHSIQGIVYNDGILPEIPPLEKHPYITPLDNQATITGLMIGTFPPISYLCSQHNLAHLTNTNGRPINPPDIDYFHGNMNSLWKYSPVDIDGIMNHPREIQPLFIENYLNQCKIVYSDIIKFTQRIIHNNRYDARDNNLRNIIPNNDIFDFIFSSESINRIYFTNSTFVVGNRNIFNPNDEINLNANDAFSLFIKAALNLGIEVGYQLCNDDGNQNNWIALHENPRNNQERNLINEHLSTKIVLKLRMNRNNVEKTFEVCSCISPAAVNRNAHTNPCCVRYGELHDIPIGIERAQGLLRTVLNCFFNDQLGELMQYNV